MSVVLIVDDKEENIYLLSVLMEGNGYQVLLARNGEEALAKAREQVPDVIVADILMPVMDGFALCREWKKAEPLRSVPFIFYTATYTDERDRDFALGLGADKFIVKPEEPEVVLKEIKDTLERVGQGSAAAQASQNPNLAVDFYEQEESGYLKQYNEVLVRKLETKMELLERTNRQLEQEIERKKQTETKLQLLASALNAADNAIHITNPDGSIQWINPAWTRLTGYVESDAIGQNLRLLKSGQHDAVFYKDLWDTINAGKVWKGELVNRRKDGSLFTATETITPVLDEQKSLTHFVAVCEDITERKQLERQLLLAQRMESLGRLATGIAHDLNNILTPVMMCPSFLRAKESPADVEEVAVLIENNTRRAKDIIKQLLTYGRGIGGERVSVDLKGLIEELVRVAKATFPRTITTQSYVPGDLHPIVGDATQLHQVLLNLCINARDAMPQGGALFLSAENVMVDHAMLAMHPENKPGAYVRARVIDSGVGIPPEIMDKLFEPFFTTKDIGKGTGLGLSTAIGIVKSHDGFIDVHSKLGQGTVFEVYLPASPGLKVSKSGRTDAEPTTGNGELILLVDDEEIIREMTRRYLERSGYRVLVASSGPDALSIFERRRTEIRLVLSDLLMPGMDGQELTMALRKIDSYVPIVLSSGLGDGLDHAKKDELREVGVNYFLAKPYSGAELLPFIGAIL